jgi:hypothetical protein
MEEKHDCTRRGEFSLNRDDVSESWIYALILPSWKSFPDISCPGEMENLSP